MLSSVEFDDQFYCRGCASGDNIGVARRRWGFVRKERALVSKSAVVGSKKYRKIPQPFSFSKGGEKVLTRTKAFIKKSQIFNTHSITRRA